MGKTSGTRARPKARGKAVAARTSPGYGFTSFEGSVDTLKQIERELTLQADYIEELRRSKDEPIHHDFILQATDCLWRIRERVALSKDARRHTPDEHVSLLVNHLRVLRTDAEKIQLRVLQDRYSGRRRGAMGTNQRAIIDLLAGNPDASTIEHWHAFKKMHPDAMKYNSFKVAVSKARSAINSKKR